MKNIIPLSNFESDEINESLGGGRDSTKEGGVKNFNYSKIVKLDGSLFKLGKDEIDTTNPQFQRAVEILRPMRNSAIVVVGSASAVGSDKGFDNKKLALDRAKNFVEALKTSGVDTSKYITNSVVGKATIANSKEANAEQCVTFKIKENGSAIRFEIERDNTAVVVPKVFKIKNVAPPVPAEGDYVYLVYKVTIKKEKAAEVAKKIADGVKGSGGYLANITKEYLNLLKK
jgi:outer membrane protein OmpA-like peptidoglycan-associated protein